MRYRKWITAIATAVIISGWIFCKLTDNKAALDLHPHLSLAGDTAIPITTERPEYRDLSENITLSGRIDYDNKVVISANCQGVVMKKGVDVGDRITKGCVIAQIEDDVINENLRLSYLDLQRAQTDVERYKRLSAMGAVTLQELESTQIVLRGIESRIIDLKHQKANTVIKSPITGIVNNVSFDEGSLLSFGSRVAEIVDDTSLCLYVNVPDIDIMELHKGMDAVVETDNIPEVKIRGVIKTISPTSTDSYYYSAEITLNNTDKRLRAGMFAKVTFTSENTAGSISVSRDAVSGSMESPYIYVVKNSRVKKVPVTIGIMTSKYVEIIDGISVNDTIVKSGHDNISDGVQIIITEK